MDDLHRAEASPSDIEGYVVSGWSALERGDLTGARAALRDLYSADPAHPALPLLAAGIRRVRPTRVPWRAVVLAVVVIAAVVGVRSWNPHARVTPQHTTAAEQVVALPQSTPSSAEMGRVLGTAGRVQPPILPTAKQNPSPTLDEDVIVRQAIKRFEVAYRNRWGDLTFEHCDVGRELDRATATCLPPPDPNSPEAESDRVWTFSLRKAEGEWRIASVQPPVALPR